LREIGQFRKKMTKIVILLSLLAFILAGCGRFSNKAGAKFDNSYNDGPSNFPVARPPETVRITAPYGLTDNAVLVGTYFESPHSNSPALLLLHQWQSDRHSFDDFAQQMQAKGFSVLSIDGRGFGESTKKEDGTTIGPGRSDADVKAMLGDIGAAFNFLERQPGVDHTRVSIVGASYGSSLAIIYAADHPSVASVALLSPGLNYFGNIPTEPAVKKYGDRPLYMTAARDDQESADAVDKLAAAGNNPKYTSKVREKGGHGTALFKVGLNEDLEEFFTKN
jgi:pimeloyl-ACP methyl ester carboxylesterase